MAATPVTPIPCLTSVVATGNTAVTAVDVNPNGGFLQNPASAGDQGLGASEDMIVNPVTAAAAPGVAGGVNGTNFRIPPGGGWNIIAGQTTQTSVNAASSGHKFSGVSW
jgi:hypothetical protein